jgi:hypothetical protein
MKYYKCATVGCDHDTADHGGMGWGDCLMPECPCKKMLQGVEIERIKKKGTGYGHLVLPQAR